MSIQTRRILLIEDDSVDREFIVRVLGARYAVIQAGHAEEGCAHFDTLRPDCVLLDYHLPGIDGISLLQRFAPSNIPVIMLTGIGDEELAVQALKAGAFDYIPKGKLDEGRLVSVVQRAISSYDLESDLAGARKNLEDLVAVSTGRLLPPLKEITEAIDEIMESPQDSLSGRTMQLLAGSRERTSEILALLDSIHEYTQFHIDPDSLTEVDLNECFELARTSLSKRIPGISIDVQASRLPIVTGSRPDLEKLFEYLVAFSVSHPRKATRRIQIEAVLAIRDWRIGIDNNGFSIAEHERDIVFEPFRYSPLEATTWLGEVGMATCKKIVQFHGGRIWLESGRLGGSGVRFTIPATQAQLSNWGNS